MGFGGHSLDWSEITPLLARDYHVVTVDNRGAGKSGAPEMEIYTIAQMADDAVDLLHHLRITRAHVPGRIDGWDDRPGAGTPPP